jgi:hypothetical protein
MEWKWTKGEPYERSRRIPKQKEQNDVLELVNKDLENSAYSSSLHYDENTWGILNETVAVNGFKVSNKREDLGQRMADRGQIQQIGFNPFLQNSNYAEDISVCDQFLKPVNTSEGRVKAEN